MTVPVSLSVGTIESLGKDSRRYDLAKKWSSWSTHLRQLSQFGAVAPCFGQGGDR